ncbi:hypothetical protein [Rossellomorea sp. BNER]
MPRKIAKVKVTVRKKLNGAVKNRKRENDGTKDTQWCREKSQR